MRRGAIGGLLGKNSRGGDSSANGGTGRAGFNSEAAAELGHAFAHSGNAHTEVDAIGLGEAIGGKLHAVAEINDLQGDRVRVLAEPDGGGVAAGVALNVGEAFLNDAEEGELGELR